MLIDLRKRLPRGTAMVLFTTEEGCRMLKGDGYSPNNRFMGKKGDIFFEGRCNSAYFCLGGKEWKLLPPPKEV